MSVGEGGRASGLTELGRPVTAVGGGRSQREELVDVEHAEDRPDGGGHSLSARIGERARLDELNGVAPRPELTGAGGLDVADPIGIRAVR